MAGPTYSISEIREEITKLPEHFDREPEAVTVTRHGKPVMAILPFKSYQQLLEALGALQETLAIVQDADMMAAFRQGVEELRAGQGIPLDEALKELGW